MIYRSIIATLLFVLPTAAFAQTATPIYGVTFDDVSNPNAEVNALNQMTQTMTVRIYFDRHEPASYYVPAATKISTVSYIMGELLDSSDMAAMTPTSAKTRAENYFGSALSNYVDLWEIGNEVNGSWLGSSTLAKVENMYDVVSNGGGKTSLTFFYEGEPSDPNNCIDTSGGGNDMFTWINQKFQLSLPPAQRSAETEKIRNGVNFVLVSWYPDQCPGEMPNWPWVFTELSQIFPNAYVGFGELGTAKPQDGSQYERDEIANYYPMAAGVGGLPDNYIRGVFWWYAAEEMVPWPSYLGNALNGAIQ